MKRIGRRFQASRTAEWVAAARTLGGLFPPELSLARDPYGVAFADGGARMLADVCLRHPWLARRLLTRAGPLTGFLLWMQLRTRALDDVLCEFLRTGGRQVVLLGAGYDCRALRFGEELGGGSVFEVDHPATQAGKIARLPAETVRTHVVYVGWDFERDALETLPQKLHEQGLDPRARVLTIWEGVTMYLGEPAIEATVRAVHDFGAPGSLLALTYIDKRALSAPDRDLRLTASIVARAGEPYRFGFLPEDLGLWFSARGFSLVSDVSDAELATRFFPARVWSSFKKKTRRLAVVSVRGGRESA